MASSSSLNEALATIVRRVILGLRIVEMVIWDMIFVVSAITDCMRCSVVQIYRVVEVRKKVLDDRCRYNKSFCGVGFGGQPGA